jgi:hypothetical protein
MHFGIFIDNQKINVMKTQRENKPTKTEFIKQLQRSEPGHKSKTSAYDLNENGGFNRKRDNSDQYGFLRFLSV